MQPAPTPVPAFGQRLDQRIGSYICTCSKGGAMVFAGQLGMLAALLKRGCQVNAPTNDGWTGLHEAAANGHALIVDKLLASGAQVPSWPYPCCHSVGAARETCLMWSLHAQKCLLVAS